LHPSAVAARFALRVRGALWRFGTSPGSLAFERAVRGAQLAVPGAGGPELEALAPAAFAAPHVVRSARGLELQTPVDRRLVLLVPAGSALRATATPLASESANGPATDAAKDPEALSVALYPATDLRLREAASVLAIVDVRAGSRARLELATLQRTDAQSALSVAPVLAGEPARLRIAQAPRDARVAYELGEKTALAGAELSLGVLGALEEPARALVMSRTAPAELLRTRVPVTARRPPGCSLDPASPPSSPWAAALLCSAVMLLKIRRRQGSGNRLGPHVRCELRHGAQYNKHTLDLLGLGVSFASLHALRVRADHDPQHARRGHAREP